MNKILPACLLVCSIALSCNKPLPDYSHLPFDYTVTGIADTSVPANAYIFFNPTINVASGNAANEAVTVTFKGTPANVFIQKNGFSFKLNYELMDSFGAQNAAPGVYPMQAIFSSPTTSPKTYNFNLTVTAPVDRTAKVAGGFYPSGTCGNYIYVSCEIDSVPGSPGKIMIIDRTSPNSSTYGTFDTAYGIVDCCSNTFTIPSQKVQGVTISGSGSSNGLDHPYRVVQLSRVFTTDTSSYPCIVTLTQD